MLEAELVLLAGAKVVQQIPIDKYPDALRSIVNKPYLKSPKYQEQQWRAVRTGVHPDILDFERLFIRRMASFGVPMFASEMMRTPERQAELIRQGHSWATVETAMHPKGRAVDIIHSILAWDLQKKAWDMIGHIGKEVALQNGLRLVWGGDWKKWDPAHWETERGDPWG